MPNWEIATAEKVDPAQITRDLQAMQDLLAEHEKAIVNRAERQRQVATATYRMTIREALTEWERSKSDKERERAKETSTSIKGAVGVAKVVLPGVASTLASIKTEQEAAKEGRLGDPQYLRVVIEARKRIDELEGLTRDDGSDGSAMIVKCYGFNPFTRPDA